MQSNNMLKVKSKKKQQQTSMICHTRLILMLIFLYTFTGILRIIFTVCVIVKIYSSFHPASNCVHIISLC